MKYYRLTEKSKYKLNQRPILVDLARTKLMREEDSRIYELGIIPADNAEPIDYYQIFAYGEDEDNLDDPEVRERLDTELLDIYALRMSNINTSVLITAKMKAVLERFVICKPYRFYPAKLLFRGKKYDYFIFTIFFESIYSKIFPMSVYKLRERRSEEIDHSREYRFKDYDDYKQKSSELYFASIKIDADEPSWYYYQTQTTLLSYSDVLYMINGGVFFVSERLKSALEAADIEYLGFELLEEEFEFLEGVPEDMQ